MNVRRFFGDDYEDEEKNKAKPQNLLWSGQDCWFGLFV